ncbi:MAG TPA: type II toxin-antitoxin system VapC family toxin [Acidobacteriaceae bacterium]|nr:type II toxin-antitoxin system VapC family toxin [Acidobacteriaceae bacterium]
MLAVDSNVVVRYLARDDSAQTARATRLIRTEPILLLKTVLLESEWVLRSAYGFDRNATAGAFRSLAGLPTVHVEDEAAVAQALDWFAAGMDFADALHLSGSSGAVDQFATFDRRLAKTAQRLAPTNLLLLS